MKKYRLKITKEDFDELKRLVLIDMPRENVAFALAGVSMQDNQVDVLVRRPVPVPAAMMIVQNEYHLEVAPQAINGLVSLCESNKLGAVICHSHPYGLDYSPSDDHGERRIANALRDFIPANAPIASLLFTPEEVTGRIWVAENSSPIVLDEIIVVGHYVHRIKTKKNRYKNRSREGLYDRQVRALGEDGQRAISDAKIGIIGVGGTGSPIAEQLARLGVSDIVLIDPDKFSPSNITRV
ncbi:MAG TPA: ThiF family adenylyltransferase, partial [Oculatellaceae cyanobacterium]